jgi:hypothetical protein
MHVTVSRKDPETMETGASFTFEADGTGEAQSVKGESQTHEEHICGESKLFGHGGNAPFAL